MPLSLLGRRPAGMARGYIAPEKLSTIERIVGGKSSPRITSGETDER